MDKVDVKIAIDTFEHEARDYAHHSLNDFYKSSHFNKDFKFEGRHIVTTTKIWADNINMIMIAVIHYKLFIQRSCI